MEKRIELERRARKANQITELNLDNCRSTSIVGLTDEYTALESLSLINVGLTTLKGFPKLPNLKKLELSDNRISNGLNYLTTSPKLQYLNLSGNKIKDLETLKPLEEFKNLAVLDLFNNEATQVENYREKIFQMLPSLKFLDGFDANDVEAPSDGDDDEEANGVDSEDDVSDDVSDTVSDSEDEEDKQKQFCLNGLEIDLNELEEFEKRLKAKRKAAQKLEKNINSEKTERTALQCDGNGGDDVGRGTKAAVKVEEEDDLDVYLRELKLREEEENSITTTTTTTNTTCDTTPNLSRQPMNFGLILYWFLAILNLASAAYHFGDDDEDGEGEGEGGDDDPDDNSDVSLSEVYNDELEEDNSEWDEGDGVESDDNDDADGGAKDKPAAAAEKKEDDSAAATAAAAPATATEDGDESQTRGKKRKHDD